MGTNIVKAKVFNIDTNQYEEVECIISDDLYKIITNGIGEHYSLASDLSKGGGPSDIDDELRDSRMERS